MAKIKDNWDDLDKILGKITLDNAQYPSCKKADDFIHLHVDDMEADWETFDKIVGDYVRNFQKNSQRETWNVCCEFIAVVLSDLWQEVE